MGRPFVVLLATCALFLSSSVASAAIVEHSFYVKNLTVNRLCKEQVITTVNGSLPGPTLRVREGDTLIVHVFNHSPYNITIHWHGIFQILSAWADGPEYINQCPIPIDQSYTYKFKIINQEGTLWWHAHSSVLRTTVYGAIIIRPRRGHSYPFPKPYREMPILLGEWYNGNIVTIENQGLTMGVGASVTDAYTINGLTGDLYNCSQTRTYKLKVVQGKTYLIRLINAALNNQMFFKISNHNMIVVSIDASYIESYNTNVIVISPGQTTDVLVKFDQPIGSYYMAARPYTSSPGVPVNDTITRGVIIYEGSTSSSPSMPTLPLANDTSTAHKFYTNVTGLVGGPHWVDVPTQVDEHMFITIGTNLDRCRSSNNATCQGPLGQRISSSMNNESFVLPSSLSMLQALYYNISGIYTRDFPNQPPVIFDYTNPNTSFDESLIYAPKSTKAKKLKYNATVEIVLQGTAFNTVESHPMHLHGFSFHVLAQGFGNYDPTNDNKKFNLVNPQFRNTIVVPVGGWAVIRFQANNPGIWMFHCHVDQHMPWGLVMTFEVENGGNPWSTLPPPPNDLPKC